MTRYLVIPVLAAVAVLAILLAQQPGGVDEIRARSAQDLANQAAYASQPGGTPEDRAWEVLVLMGAGDTAPAEWNGTLSATGGEVFEIRGYRTELPDRILPQGQIQTRIEKILESSPVEGGGQPENALLPGGRKFDALQKEMMEMAVFEESRLMSIDPKMSYVSKEMAAGDPDFWTPKPKPAAKPASTSGAPKQTGQ